MLPVNHDYFLKDTLGWNTEKVLPSFGYPSPVHPVSCTVMLQFQGLLNAHHEKQMSVACFLTFHSSESYVFDLRTTKPNLLTNVFKSIVFGEPIQYTDHGLDVNVSIFEGREWLWYYQLFIAGDVEV